MRGLADYEIEAGSFRDRNGRVFYLDGSVFRGLSEQALQDWEILSSRAFFRRFVAEGKLVQTELAEIGEVVRAGAEKQWAAFLKHETIPFVSYPYEWSFGMLKDAALLQLEMLTAALEEDMILKDSSAYNVQWAGVGPVFIDIPSFQRLVPGEPWVGYLQFCQMFLYPLFLQAYKDVSFHPWLRGRIDGMDPETCYRLMSISDLLRPGVFKHVYLHAKLQKNYDHTRKDIKTDLRQVGFNKELIKANLRGLSNLVQGLTWKRSRSQWSDYANDNSYNDTDRDRKESFVREVVSLRRWNLVWDLGCNVGTFSRIAAANADRVIAMDADHLSVERLYQALKTESNTNILPLVVNVADPSPSLGWRSLERKSLIDRGKPDLTLCLALVHHLAISANIPVKEIVAWLASLGTSVIIEFVTKDDPMVRVLLRNKEDNYADYEINYFEQCMEEHFVINRREMLSSGSRVLFFAENKLVP